MPSVGSCCPRSENPDPSTSLRTGSGAPHFCAEFGFEVSHPSGKNRDAARVGHPVVRARGRSVSYPALAKVERGTPEKDYCRSLGSARDDGAEVGFVVSHISEARCGTSLDRVEDGAPIPHPGGKNRDAARVGHPVVRARDGSVSYPALAKVERGTAEKDKCRPLGFARDDTESGVRDQGSEIRGEGSVGLDRQTE